MAEGIVSTVAAPVIENSVNAIGRQFGYLWNYKKNMANLEKQVMILGNKISDMSRFVTAAERNAEEIGDDVHGWLSEAKDISAREMKFLEEHAKKGKNKCLVGFCPNLVSRHQFSRSACKKKMDVVDAIAREGQIIKVSFRPVGQESVVLSTAGFFTFDSRQSIMKNIMKALQDETKRMVGVYGLGGMGKTTLAKQVASQAKEEKLFVEVVFASVTQNVDMKEIQGQLASMLDLKLDESTVAESANRVHQRLKGKKVLVILDDLWKELDLNEVGISLGVENMRCKILLTSRYKHVLSSMGTEEFFNVDALGEEEAWKLFEKKNNIVHTRSDINKIGKEIAQRCRGWPVLIVTIAASLSRQSELSIWKDALNQLKKMNNKKMHDIVNYAIETISYNQLAKTHKRLFLLCGVMGGVASIEELLQYSWGWDLFDGEAATIQEARDRLHKLILDLKESCLLMDDVDCIDSIIMHDVVKDVAISIGKKDLNMISMGAKLNTWPKDDDLKKCTVMVLRGCPNLPPRLECPSLEVFVLSDTSVSIPETFFEKTSKLKVLGMSRLQLTSLPPSISFLKNLQTLRVYDCDSLNDLSVVGELKKLQILGLAGYGIEELPSGLGQLSDLRLLDMRGCSELEVIHVGLIKGLSQLEELYVDREFDRWEADECVYGSVKTNGSLRELEHLAKLSSLEIKVEDIKLLPENLNFENLERYKIIVGNWKRYGWSEVDNLQVTRMFYMQVSTTSINLFHYGVKKLLKTTECLCLEEVKGIPNVAPALDGDGFPNLKHLWIEGDYEIQYIVNVEETQHNVMFPSLESLQLDELTKLQKLCNGPLMEQSFCNLTIVKVHKCNELENMFSFSMATKLPMLQKIEISMCNVLEEIVGEKNINGDEVCEEIEFVQLRILSLQYLPNLKNFFNCLRSDDADCQEMNAEKEKDLISSLPFFKKVSFPKLTILEIIGCSNLRYLLTPSVATCLVGLQSLIVQYCPRMKHVVAKEEGDTNTVATITFPQLSYLCLQNLDQLTTFYPGFLFEEMNSSDNLDTVTFLFPKLMKLTLQRLPKAECFYPRKHTIQCPKLKELNVDDCGNLSTFDFRSFPEKQGDALFEKVLSNLKMMSLRNYDLMKVMGLYDQNLPPRLFRCLENLNILDFHGESVVFLSKFLSIIHNQLGSFKVFSCSFKEIFPSEGEVTHYDNDYILLPQLKNLVLKKLPELKYICKQDQYPPCILNALERLETIRVEECPSLTNIVPSGVSFRSLMYLNVFDCNGLTNLIQPSTAKSLGKLLRLTISGCGMMEKIIGDDGEESIQDGDEFIFTNLQDLTLTKLPRLTSFCSFPNHAFNFPKLGWVSVRECPNMKTFCGGITTTPWLYNIYYDYEGRWEGDLNTTIQHSFAEKEANALSSESSSEKLIDSMTEVEGCPKPEKESEVSKNSTEPRKRTETCEEVVEEGKEGDICVNATAPEKGKGKEVKVSEQFTKHSDPSSKLSNHSEASTSSNNQSDQDAEKAVEPRKQPQLINHVVDELGNNNTYCDNAIEPRKANMEDSAKARECHSDATNAEKTADTFGEGSMASRHVVASSSVTNPPTQTSLSLFPELDVGRSTCAVSTTSSCSDQKLCETQNHSVHFIPLLSEFLQTIQNQPLKSMSKEHVQFMENAYRDLSDMNFSINWFIPYVDKAREYLTVLEQRREVSELESEIAKMEAQMEAMKQKKRALQQKYDGIASHLDLDKSLYKS